MSPAVSKKQNAWANSPAGHKALGDAGVKEWDAATKKVGYKNLPERAPKKK